MVASFILVIHGLTFLVPHDPETEDTDMMRIIGKWFGFDWDWMKHFTPYAQVPKIFFPKSVLPTTAWKFHDFSITQILREITFSDTKSEKSAVLTHLKALNFDFYVCIFAISEQS